MPGGPSIMILKEALAPFEGRKLLAVSGSVKAFDIQILKNKTVKFRTRGKHFLLCIPKFTIRIHFLLFGSYLINERKDAIPRLHLKFAKGEVNFYPCAASLLEELPDNLYDWSTDIMNSSWNSPKALTKLDSIPDTMVCVAILDQHIFAGAWNIFKNEVLFRIRVQPASLAGQLPSAKRKATGEGNSGICIRFPAMEKSRGA